MNAAEQIKERINMMDVLDVYGFHPNRAGFICCPFHEEKTPSLKAYKNHTRWHCFGCDAGGNVIDFVMRLFGLNFRQAVVRIDVDFGLCLNTGKRLTVRERHEAIKKRAERLKLVQEQKSAAYEAFEDYLFMLEEWILCDEYIKRFAYENGAEWSELFAYAVRKRERLGLLIDCYDFK